MTLLKELLGEGINIITSHFTVLLVTFVHQQLRVPVTFLHQHAPALLSRRVAVAGPPIHVLSGKEHMLLQKRPLQKAAIERSPGPPYPDIPPPHQAMLRYCGRSSNAARGKRRTEALGISVTSRVDCTSEPNSPAERFARHRRRHWARLLKKIYEVDPLRCPDWGGQMQIIAFLQEPGVIRKILRHLNLWELPPRSPPPRLFPHKLEALLASLTPQQAQQIRAGTDSLFWEEAPVWKD